VPTHLRDAHYRSAASIGHGEGYVYPHDQPGAWTDQQYRPEELAGNRYYEPSDRGHEAVVAQRLRQWRHESGPDGGGSAPVEDREDDPPAGVPGAVPPVPGEGRMNG
jgi:putative ATPase